MYWTCVRRIFQGGRLASFPKFLEKIRNQCENGSTKNAVTGFWLGVLPDFYGRAPRWGTLKNKKSQELHAQLRRVGQPTSKPRSIPRFARNDGSLLLPWIGMISN